MNQIDLSGRRAVVTGGANGIGRAVVDRFIASGAAVTIWDADRAAAEEAASVFGCGFVQVDVTDWDAVRSAAHRAAAEMGGLDILVASAGIAGDNASVEDLAPESWRRVMAVNADGIFHCCKAVIPFMREGRYGRIVNIASVAGKEGNPNAAHYSASKAAVIALTKSLGKELAGEDIAVNCVTPAAARTAIFEQMSQTHIDYMLSKIPRGRFVDVEEIAAMIAWLASAENSFTTGGVFDLSGGRATY